MKKILTILFLTLTIGFVSQPVYAATDVLTNTCANAQQNSGHAPGICNDNQTNNTTNPISSIFKTVLELLSWAIGFIAVVVIIIAGLRLVVSGGDPQTLNSARNAILYAVVGLIVAALAQIIVFFVLGKV